MSVHRSLGRASCQYGMKATHMSFRAKLQSRALQTAMNAVAVLAMIALLLASSRQTGYLLAAIALALAIWVSATVSFALTMPAQLLIVVGLLADYQHSIGHAGKPTLIATGVVLSALVVTQPNLQELVNQQVLNVTHLPGYQRERSLVAPPRVFYIANILLIVALGISAVVRAPLWPVLAAAIIACLGVGLVGAQALWQRLHGRTDSKSFRAALIAYDPRFAVYFSAPDNTEYQLTMWLPYLERIGSRFVVIVREEPAFARIATRTKAPVIFCPTVNQVDTCVTDRMRACFYVNNGAKNTHIVRFNHLTHIQLLHGDSDKASSFNPVTAMFDRIFVAGQAGIDRYAANGVHIPLDRFDIVGRPQVERIDVSATRIGDRPDDRKTVLYATTWVGLYTDANYCSLPSGERIVADLLDRGVRVIFRPHPVLDPGRRLVADGRPDRGVAGRGHRQDRTRPPVRPGRDPRHVGDRLHQHRRRDDRRRVIGGDRLALLRKAVRADQPAGSGRRHLRDRVPAGPRGVRPRPIARRDPFDTRQLAAHRPHGGDPSTHPPLLPRRLRARALRRRLRLQPPASM